jgi:hypothetical protein
MIPPVPIWTRNEMMRRVAFFKELKAAKGGLPDSDLPGYERELIDVIGLQPPQGGVSPVGAEASRAPGIPIMHYFIATFSLVFALGFGQAALAADTGWGNASNGNGYHHESNGASTGWGMQENGYRLYHESNAGSTGWGNASNGDGYYHESNGSATVSGVQGG